MNTPAVFQGIFETSHLALFLTGAAGKDPL